LTIPDRKITIVSYDPQWPELFQREAERIHGVLGNLALRIDHTGSTAVPGLPAKPIVDITLAVADSSRDAAYVPALQSAGYTLRIREPEWHEHRMLTGPDTAVNLHVFSAGCPEIDRILLFRDWLRSHPADRDLYARTKRTLAQREWNSVDEYATAKGAVIAEILARARGPLCS
jgi:GrpB-like predicted nucleotidyltransferase (UPF0157 family)